MVCADNANVNMTPSDDEAFMPGANDYQLADW
jgi:hypothetical protein